MSQTFECDGGCGFTSSNSKDLHVVGFVVEKEYCSKCSVIVEMYLQERDELHTELTATWKRKKDRLKSRFLKELKNGSLPDE
jgi:hypothetical protein